MHAYVVGRERTALVSQLAHRFAWAWNAHDMDAAFADFDDDADFIDATGQRFHGYDEIVETHAALHETTFARSEMTVDDVRLRLISVDSAYLIADWTMHGIRCEAAGATPIAGASRRGTMMFVVARQGSSWRVFSAQVTSR